MNTPESTLFNAVPVVSELNRVAGFDPLRFLKKTANGHELDLRYKKLWFRLKYPAGRTRLTPLRITDQLAIIEAKVFFDKDDADPASSYIATMTQENAPAGLYIQAAEHDALDMALTNAGFGIQFAPMPKADTPYAEPTTPVMRSEPAPAPQAAAEQVRTEPAAVRADIEPVVVQQPEQEVVHHAEKAVPDTAPVEVSAEQPAEAVVEPAVETELPFVYDEPSAASYTKDMDVDISLCSDGHCSTSPYYLAPAYKDDLTPWKCGYRPHFFSWRDSFEGDTAGHLYFRNLAELLRNTPWQYSQIERFARIAATMDAIPYLNAYVQWPVIEYLVKAKLFRLVSDIVYGSYHFMIGKTVNCEGKNLQDVLKLDRSWLPLLQEVDPGIAQLNVIQWFIYAGKRPDASMMKWCANNAIQDVSVLAELLSHMTMHKLMRYADAQYEIHIASTKTPEYIRYYSMANLLADYRDYLRMCKEMQYNVESSFILFPRNLKSAHDHVVEALDVKRTAEQEKAIADSFEEWQRLYQYKGKDLMVIPPHSSKELIDEGTALRHCVGRYVKRVAQRECVILFVRKVAEPDKSLCTVEVRDGQVVQTRGFDNEDPPAKIKAFIERWKRQVLCAADKTAA